MGNEWTFCQPIRKTKSKWNCFFLRSVDLLWSSSKVSCLRIFLFLSMEWSWKLREWRENLQKCFFLWNRTVVASQLLCNSFPEFPCQIFCFFGKIFGRCSHNCLTQKRPFYTCAIRFVEAKIMLNHKLAALILFHLYISFSCFISGCDWIDLFRHQMEVRLMLVLVMSRKKKQRKISKANWKCISMCLCMWVCACVRATVIQLLIQFWWKQNSIIEYFPNTNIRTHISLLHSDVAHSVGWANQKELLLAAVALTETTKKIVMLPFSRKKNNSKMNRAIERVALYGFSWKI